MTVWIEVGLCNTCNRCVTICPYSAITLTNNTTLSINDRCTECGLCIKSCKKKAILTNAKLRTIPDFSQYKGVWVFIEHDSKGIKTVSVEILGKAQELAKNLNQKVTALLLGYGVSALASNLGGFGADEVLIVDNKLLEYYDSQSYSSVIKKIVKPRNPNIFLFGATCMGRDLAPRVAKLIGSGLTADCTELAIDPDKQLLIQTRPAFGGNILATIINQFSRPQMATVRPGVMIPGLCQKRKIARVEELEFKIDHVPTKILEIITDNDSHVELNNAKIIVAGGRGMETTDGFNMLHQLAFSLKGEVAGTRVAVENGWISEKRQVGQTGQTVRADLYIACGVSGAIQHRAGMMNSKFIVAINKDPYAAIFKIATWGIIGNVFDVIPELINHIQVSSKADIFSY